MLYYIIMVSSTLLHASSQGAEDKVLYGNPKMTYFKNVYTRARNFATEYTKISKKPGKIDFGSTFTIDIPNIGDLLAGIYFDFKLSDLKRTSPYTPSDIPLTPDSSLVPKFTSYVNGIGYNIIDHVELYINGNLIQRLNSELIYLINELNHNSNKIKSFHRISYYHESFIIANNNISNIRCHIKLPFYFSNNPGLYLPLCSLQHSSIELRVKLKSFDQCIIRKYRTEPDSNDLISGIDGFKEDSNNNIVSNGIVPAQYSKYNESVQGTIESFDIITQKVFLDPDEQKLFLSIGKLDYLIELFHIGNTETINNPGPESTYTFDIIAKHPTKYIFWVLQRKDVFDDRMYQNYTYDYRARYKDGYYLFDKNSHILDKLEISMNNVNIVEGISPLFLTNMHKYESFDGAIDNPVYLHNFSLSPSDIKPSGTLNLSAYHKKTFRLNLSKKENYTNNSITSDILFRHYTCHYNVLVISDGTCGLVYK